MPSTDQSPFRLYALARSRGAVLFATYAYALTLYYAHVTYLNPIWGYQGFSYRPPDAAEALLMIALLTAGGALLPATLARPSSIIVLLLYVIVYVPTAVLTLSLAGQPLERYGMGLVMLGIGFAIVCLAARQRMTAEGQGVPSARFWVPLVVLWAICGAAIVLRYYPTMRFATLAQVYLQRAVAGTVDAGPLLGYAQTYFSLVFGPALVAIGLAKGRWLLVALGTIGGVIMYMVNAQRTLILLPFVLMALHLMLTTRFAFVRSTPFLILFLSAVVLVAVASPDDNLITSFFALYVVNRTIGIPGLTFAQYYDLFGTSAFTWWSHVKGLSLVVAQPVDYLGDWAWPNLGFMVGDRVLRSPTLNANANLFASDGVAAAGALGVSLIAIALAAWLWVLDRVSAGWSQKFGILITLPMAVSLTNGSLFTTLLSFGGLFWTLTFYLYKPPVAR
jgi:hypothetical protein